MKVSLRTGEAEARGHGGAAGCQCAGWSARRKARPNFAMRQFEVAAGGHTPSTRIRMSTKCLCSKGTAWCWKAAANIRSAAATSCTCGPTNSTSSGTRAGRRSSSSASCPMRPCADRARMRLVTDHSRCWTSCATIRAQNDAASPRIDELRRTDSAPRPQVLCRGGAGNQRPGIRPAAARARHARGQLTPNWSPPTAPRGGSATSPSRNWRA